MESMSETDRRNAAQAADNGADADGALGCALARADRRQRAASESDKRVKRRQQDRLSRLESQDSVTFMRLHKIVTKDFREFEIVEDVATGMILQVSAAGYAEEEIELSLPDKPTEYHPVKFEFSLCIPGKTLSPEQITRIGEGYSCELMEQLPLYGTGHETLKVLSRLYDEQSLSYATDAMLQACDERSEAERKALDAHSEMRRRQDMAIAQANRKLIIANKGPVRTISGRVKKH